MELTPEDRERIEQEAASKFIRYPAKKSFILGAEYATRYEREQQIKTLNRPGSKVQVSDVTHWMPLPEVPNT